LRRYKAKRVKTRCYQERVGHLEPRFQGEGVVPGEYFLVSTHFAIRRCNLHRATAVVLTPYRRVTAGRTELQCSRRAVNSEAHCPWCHLVNIPALLRRTIAFRDNVFSCRDNA